MGWVIEQHYVLDGFSAECSVPFKRKLLCMGFTPGVEFVTVRRAPLGDPWEVKIKGTHLSMRLVELNLLKAKPV